MDGMMFTSTLNEPFKENKILYIHCLDAAAKTAIQFTEVPCFSFHVVMGHCSLPDSLANGAMVLFPDCETVKSKFREIKSPAVIEVKSSSVVKVDGKEIAVITDFDVQMSLTGAAVDLQPVNPSVDEQCTITLPPLDFEKCICNCSRFPRVGQVLVNQDNLHAYSNCYGSQSDSESSDESSEEHLYKEKNDDQSDPGAMHAEKINLKGAYYHADFQLALKRCQRKQGNRETLDLKLELEPVNVNVENAFIVKAHLEGKWQAIGYIPGPKVAKVTRAMFSGTVEYVKLDKVVRKYIKDTGQNMFNGSIVVVKRGRWESDNECYKYNEQIFHS